MSATAGQAQDQRGQAERLGDVDLAYLDPPYNQHRYEANYHIWETLVAWDAPEAYGVARKRLDARDPSTHSAFNSKRTMAAALESEAPKHATASAPAAASWLGLDELEAMCAIQGSVATLAFDSARYVGARIGIFDPSGRKVGRVSHLSNQELLVIAGEQALVRRAVAAAEEGASTAMAAATTATVAAATGAASNVVAAGLVDRLQQTT